RDLFSSRSGDLILKLSARMQEANLHFLHGTHLADMAARRRTSLTSCVISNFCAIAGFCNSFIIERSVSISTLLPVILPLAQFILMISMRVAWIFNEIVQLGPELIACTYATSRRTGGCRAVRSATL